MQKPCCLIEASKLQKMRSVQLDASRCFARARSQTYATAQRQAGFIVTVELILITTILVIGSLVGLAAIRDALIKRYANQESQEITVYDDRGIKMGKAVGFDEHEAPLVAYIDRSVPPLAPDPGHRNYRALIGVRDDRFTSREPMYYDGANCTGTPCIKVPSDETTDSDGVSGVGATGAVGYLYRLQRGPTYAIGSSPDGIQGYLYREEPAICPVAPANLQSRYLSQKVVAGSPCEDFTAPLDAPADTSCLVDVPLAECSCPVGYEDQGDILSLYAADIQAQADTVIDRMPGVVPVPEVNVGTICCPTGTALAEDADLQSSVVYVLLTEVFGALNLPANAQRQVDRRLDPLAGTLTCRSDFALRSAVEVSNPVDNSVNALFGFQAPFQVNLPIDLDDDSWISTAPDGEG